MVLFGGGDVTASGVIDALAADGRPGSAVRAGVRSEVGPREVIMHAGLPADGAEGFARAPEGLFRAAR